MKPDKNELERMKASMLIGADAAFQLRGYPKQIDKAECQKQAGIAGHIINGGAFNPLQHWECIEYAEQLAVFLGEAIGGGE